MSYYLNTHYSQYDASQAVVRSQGCTPTTGSNGADASTGGRVKVSPDTMWNLIPPKDQSNPNTPGWSLIDLDRAMAKLGVPFTNRSGLPWSTVEGYLDKGIYVALQGDCDQFPGGCTGFLGDHCVGIHPETVVRRGQRVDEPTRDNFNYYSIQQLRNYAIKFSGSEQSIYFGTFDNPVPQAGVMMGRFIQANGYGITSLRQLPVVAGTSWKYMDGSPGGTISGIDRVYSFGLVDGHSDNYAVAISTGRPYNDGQQRTTIALIESDKTLIVVPPDTDLDSRQSQWDKDATKLLGPRPTA